MKAFLKKYEKIVKILLILLIFVLISVATTVVLSLFGIISFNDGEMQINQAIFDSFKTTWYGCILIILIQVVITSLLSFVPGASMAFIMLLQALYNNPLLAFVVALSGVFLSSFMLYILGRFGGYNLCKKLLGEKDCEKASDLLNNKGLIFFPVMMLFPMFPDDALVMVAGTLKMSLKWFIPSIIIGRGIGVATIIFGLSIVPFDKFTTPWHWIAFILICAIGIALVFFLASRFNKYLEKKKNKNAPIVEVAEEIVEAVEVTETTEEISEEADEKIEETVEK
ncbi:MAG: VTT domain-containing protein [Ruminococcaceae bacterium]|nr:VTT domain-containing protein [Oscillospiraceae bacterium]